jgi:hypothetical protein
MADYRKVEDVKERNKSLFRAIFGALKRRESAMLERVEQVGTE